jgi:Na+/H+-dicarboxylate symporter
MSEASSSPTTSPRLALHWQILIAIGLGALAGWVSGADGAIGPVPLLPVFTTIGDLFLNALKMLIVPLVMSALISGISSIGHGANIGRMGAKAVVYYLTTSVLAILVGLVMVNLLQPGIVDGRPAGELLNLTHDATTEAALDQIENRTDTSVAAILLQLLPPNIIEAAAQGQLIGLIIFCLLFGFCMTRIEAGKAEVLRNFWQGVFETMMAVTMLLMRCAPYGVFALIAKTVATSGFAAIGPLSMFFLAVLLALGVHVFVTLTAALYFIGRVKPLAHMRAMSPALLTAFSTASSAAALPLTMRCLEEGSGVSNRTVGFVIPLGSTINMDGTALYECVAAIFIAQLYGLDLSFSQQFLIVFLALITSTGMAAIPAASLVAISVILGAIGLPLEAIGLLLVTDRLLDMVRTTVNAFSDSCGAVVVARSEGERTAIDR